MKPANSPAPAPVSVDAARRSIDRVIAWCVGVFVVSTIILGSIAWIAIRTNQVGTYLSAAGVVYVTLATAFIGVIGTVFVHGHLGSSREIEEPKVELFELEKRR